MTRVGIRELRADLSTWVRRAAIGGEVVITHRGKPVARLVSADRERTYDRLVREGAITPAKSNTGWRPIPMKLEGGATVSDLVKDQRR